MFAGELSRTGLNMTWNVIFEYFQMMFDIEGGVLKKNCESG